MSEKKRKENRGKERERKKKERPPEAGGGPLQLPGNGDRTSEAAATEQGWPLPPDSRSRGTGATAPILSSGFLKSMMNSKADNRFASFTFFFPFFKKSVKQ